MGIESSQLPENMHVYSPTELALKDKYCAALDMINRIAAERNDALAKVAALTIERDNHEKHRIQNLTDLHFAQEEIAALKADKQSKEEIVRDVVDFIRGQSCNPPDWEENVTLRAIQITNNSANDYWRAPTPEEIDKLVARYLKR